nr:hypothetical protein [Tanacetum cinerariifolium]
MVKKAFENADSSSRVELIHSKIKDGSDMSISDQRQFREWKLWWLSTSGEWLLEDRDRIAFVQELQSVVGESVPAKTVVFFKEMMNKEGSRECQLADLVNEEFVPGKIGFIGELEMLAYKFVPGKMAEFMKEIQDKDIPNLMKLQILGREFELRVREKDLFIKKLKGNMD